MSKGDHLEISQKWHQWLTENMVSLPKLNPGDSVWWHPDLVHKMDLQGDDPTCLLSLALGPDCILNRNYQRRMQHDFILGQTPPDFPAKNIEENFSDRASFDDLSPLGKYLLGFQDDLVENVSSECFI